MRKELESWCKVGWRILLSKNHVTDLSVAPNGTGQEKN